MTSTQPTGLSRLFLRDGRLRSGWRVTLYLVCYIAGLLLVQTPIFSLYLGYLVAQGRSVMDALLEATQLDRLPIWLYLALKTGELVMLFPLIYLFRRFLDRHTFLSLGFDLKRGWTGDLALGLALGGVQMALIFGIEWAGGWLTVHPPDVEMLAQGLGRGAIALILFVLVAFGEELMFRGYLQANLREGVGAWLALALTSIGFGVFHGLNPNVRLLGVVNIILAGFLMGYGRWTTGALWLSIAYHFSWNFFQGPIFSLPVSGVRYGGLLAVSDQGTAPLMTGGAFGPEAGLVGTAILLLSLPVFWWWGRRRRKSGAAEP